MVAPIAFPVNAGWFDLPFDGTSILGTSPDSFAKSGERSSNSFRQTKRRIEMNRNIAMATLGLLLAVQTSIAHAAFTDFAWDAGNSLFVPSIQQPAFDSFNNLTGNSYPPPLTRQAGAYSYNVSSPGGLFVLPNSFGPDPILSLSTVNVTNSITFSQFTGSASAIGLFIFATNVDGSLAATNPLLLSATDSSGAVYGPLPTSNYIGMGSGFFSFKSDATIVSLTIAVQPNTGVYATVDGLVLGVAAIPEPTTYLQMLAGLGLIGLLRGASGFRSRRPSRRFLP